MASNHELILTIEEGSIGGFGSHVMKLLSDRGVFDKGLKFRSMFLPDIFIDQDTPEKMYEKAGLNHSSIVQKIEEALKSNIIFAKKKINYQINRIELYSSYNDLKAHKPTLLHQLEQLLFPHKDHVSFNRNFSIFSFF